MWERLWCVGRWFIGSLVVGCFIVGSFIVGSLVVSRWSRSKHAAAAPATMPTSVPEGRWEKRGGSESQFPYSLPSTKFSKFRWGQQRNWYVLFSPVIPPPEFFSKPFLWDITFLPRSICEPANFCHEASANQPIQVKHTMVSMSSKALKFAPKIVRAGLANAATGSGMSGGKRLASLSPPKLRISSNLDGRWSVLNRKVGNEPEVVAGATGALDQPPTLRKKT